jgi:trypsin
LVVDMTTKLGWVAAFLVACGDNNVPDTKVAGQIWSDDNGNGIRDPDEAPVPDVRVYINLQGDDSVNAGDPVTRTDANGRYELIVPGAGTYDVHPLLPFGQRFAMQQKPGAPIIGGNDSGPGDYGFMVALGQPFQDVVFQFCGGVLITDRHVVTAAHCSAGANPADVVVVAGTLDPFDSGQVLEVQKIAVHPKYDFLAEDGHDIAVWTLAKPVSLDNGITTVEMLGEDTASLAEPGTLATTIGWGVSDRASQLLQQVHLPVVSAERCATEYPTALNFDTQICAGATEGGIDSCQGDSGGPLLVRDDARQVWLHAGITSYGNGCALPDVPGVYARVSALSTWAKEQAVEPDGIVRVTVDEPGDTAIADVPTHSTTRSQVGPIDARWQLTGLALPEAVTSDAPVVAHWSILADTQTLTGFTCTFEPDIAAGTPSQDVACGLGATDLQLAGFPTGLYVTELSVTRDGVSYTRRTNVVAGSPPRIDLAGALEATDGLDPDYSFAPYHIDYFDISGLTGSRAFAIDATSGGGFTMFLTLYDRDQRDFLSGGGVIAFGQPAADGQERIVVIPEPGKRYLVGVSSFEDDATGAYNVALINDGNLAPH